MNMWEEFLSDRYYPKVLDLAEHFPDRRSLYVNFRDVEIFNPEMADRILESPPQELSDAQTALRSVDLPLDVTFDENTFLRILNLPLTQRYHVNQLRAVHVGKLIAVEGMVRTATEIRPKIVSAMYRCQRCGQEFFKSQSGFQFDDKNIRCDNDACDRAGPFKLLLDQSRFIDAQRLRLQESIEDIGARSIPQILEIEAEGDIAGTINPGDRVIVNGIITSYRKPGNIALSNYFELYMKVVSIEMEEQEYEEIDISMQDQAEILKLAQKGDVLAQFRQSIAPSIYGNDVIKEALSLQLVSSPEVKNFDGTVNRGDIHVLLVGDPGVAKSQMLRYMAKISPRGLYTSGKGTTSAGLTATAVKDEHGDGRWTIEAGALPLSDRGICCIDEMDKMNEKDREGLHEGMEQQTVSVSKAGISATLRCRCSVLAAANPTAGRFDRAGIIADQINLLPTLLSRFDLIFICLDVPDKDQDRELADHILNVRTHPQSKAPVIEPALLRKYIAYARRNIFPELSEEAGKEIKEFWLSLRGQYGGKPNQPIPTTARQLEALYRLASASARLRLSATIDGQDAKKAIDLTEYCMKQVGVDPETGLFDVGVIDLGTPKTESDKTLVVERIIRELGRQSQGKAAEEEILAAAFQQGIDEDRARNIISRMRRDGRLVEPRNGFYSFP